MAQGRSGIPMSFPLDKDTTQQPIQVEVNCFRVLISRVPPGGRDIRIKLDGTDYGFVREGRYYDQCEGDVFRHVSISSPAQSGELEVIACNRDALVFDSGGASGGGDLRRLLESWWLPQSAVAAGAAFDMTALPTSIPMWAQVYQAGTGQLPFMTWRSIRCAQLRANGGTSGAQGSYSPSWLRKNNDLAPPFSAQLLARVHPRAFSHNIEIMMRCDGTGNSHGGGGAGSGLMLMQNEGAGLSSLSGNVAGFGIVRDGIAGINAGWRFVSRVADGPGFDINVPLVGGPVTSWRKFRIEMIDADPVAVVDGKVNLYVDDIPSLAFRNADMDKFPPSNNNGGLRTGFAWQVLAECAAVDNLTIARAHWWLDSVEGGTS